MPALHVIDPGPMTTVQDLGRVGVQRLGIPASGAMDRPSLILANRLVGNDSGAAGLEATVQGPTLEFLERASVAITGAQALPRLNGQSMPMWTAVSVDRGDRLTVGTAMKGCRLYLSLGGGIEVPMVFGSRATYLPGGLGGLEGRPLRRGDLLTAGRSRVTLEGSGGRAVISPPPLSGKITLRVILGPQEDAFTADGLGAFFQSAYRVTTKTDRMGCRLAGPLIRHARGHDIISEGTVWGSIQVAGDGQPIILLADRPTTGGYPKIATVIRADLPLLGQVRPGDRVRFQPVSVPEAVRLLRDHEARLASMIA